MMSIRHEDAKAQRVLTRECAEDGLVRSLAKLQALTVDERSLRRWRIGKVTRLWTSPMPPQAASTVLASQLPSDCRHEPVGELPADGSLRKGFHNFPFWAAHWRQARKLQSYLRNSSFATASRWTSSGPSASRKVRWLAHALARKASWHTPSAP